MILSLMCKFVIVMLAIFKFTVAKSSNKYPSNKKYETKWEKCTNASLTETNSTEIKNDCCWENHCCVSYWKTGDFAKEYSEFQDNNGYKRCEKTCYDMKNFIVKDTCGGDLCCVITRGRDDVIKRIGSSKISDSYTFMIASFISLGVFLYGLGFVCGYTIGRRMLVKAEQSTALPGPPKTRLVSSSLPPVQSPHHLQVVNAQKRSSRHSRERTSNNKPHKSSSNINLMTNRKGSKIKN